MFTLKQFFVRYLGLGLGLIWIISLGAEGGSSYSVQRYTHTTICKKGCILIEYLVHLFVHVLVSLELKFVFFLVVCLGFKKKRERRKQTPRNNNISLIGFVDCFALLLFVNGCFVDCFCSCCCL